MNKKGLGLVMGIIIIALLLGAGLFAYYKISSFIEGLGFWKWPLLALAIFLIIKYRAFLLRLFVYLARI